MPILFRKLPPSICSQIFEDCYDAEDAHRLLNSTASQYVKGTIYTTVRKIENGIQSPAAIFSEDDKLVDFDLGQKRFNWEKYLVPDPHYSGEQQLHDSYYGSPPKEILIRKACLLFEVAGNKLELLAQVGSDLHPLMTKYAGYQQLLIVITHVGEEPTSKVKRVDLTWVPLSD